MKACQAPNCISPVFSNHYCQRHQRLRTDEKYLRKQKEKLQKKFHPVKKIVRNINFGFKGELDMFNYIWETRPHVCEFTGERLEQFHGTDLWYSCFLHVLPKGKFPLFKLNSENVRLGFPAFHTIIDQGTEADRAKHPEWDFRHWDELHQEMKEEYIAFKKENLIG